MWLPSNDHAPKIYHGGSGGHDLLLTDTVKIKMIKSSNRRIAEFGTVIIAIVTGSNWKLLFQH